MKHLVGRTQNGADVYVDLIGSEAAKHIAYNPRLLTLAGEALRSTSLKESDASVECDMGRVVGYDFIIQTAGEEGIFYAQLLRDDIYTRFIKNAKPAPTRYLSLALQRNHDGVSYDLQDVWVGRRMPPKPSAPGETVESKPYWSNHALIFDNQPLQTRTLTKTCPY